jgi:predicted dehydrogenase
MPEHFSRRHALKAGAAAAAALTLAPLSSGQAAVAQKPVRIGFIGVGARGTSLLRTALDHPSVQVPAACDIDADHLNRSLDLVQQSRGKRPQGYKDGPQDYRRLLERSDLDAVLIATPQELHTVMAIDAMRAKKFVGSEVPACCTLDECHQLVQAQRETRTGYMMLENYLYSRPVMQVQRMANAGLFGDFTYGFGAYIHDLRSMRFNSDGSLTWRGENVRDTIGIVYPTHAIGPVCRWMGINKGDRLQSLVAMSSRSAAVHEYAVRKFGAGSAAAKVVFKNGDTNQALIRTVKGRLIEVRYDTASPRPPGMATYSLQGTNGGYDSLIAHQSVYIEGRSPDERWEPLEQYAKEFDDPRWTAQSARAGSAGHGGGDFFVIQDFINAIRGARSPVDVVDAVTWSCIRPLSADSLEGGSKAVEIPDFSAA